MQTEVEVLIASLEREELISRVMLMKANQSKSNWIMYMALIGVCACVWVGSYQANKYYALGMEAGILAAQEGRLPVPLFHVECDSQGHNCVNKKGP